MNTDGLDREAYRIWWEAEGRDDLSVCFCGEEVEDLDLRPAGHPLVLAAGNGTCPRHRTLDREYAAQGVLDGRFFEHDPEPEDLVVARWVAQGRPFGRA
jgi:hypothetical protein